WAAPGMSRRSSCSRARRSHPVEAASRSSRAGSGRRWPRDRRREVAQIHSDRVRFRAMQDLLESVGRTPLVPLRRLAVGLPVPVLAKCEHMNPGGSVKDRIAVAIVDDAEERGLLRPGSTLIEATAGNTGVGLALVAAVRGYELVCVMPEKMSPDKRR